MKAQIRYIQKLKSRLARNKDGSKISSLQLRKSPVSGIHLPVFGSQPSKAVNIQQRAPKSPYKIVNSLEGLNKVGSDHAPRWTMNERNCVSRCRKLKGLVCHSLLAFVMWILKITWTGVALLCSNCWIRILEHSMSERCTVRYVSSKKLVLCLLWMLMFVSREFLQGWPSFRKK